ncbi:hypothetical protein KS4_13640 [Poriferisphaera corsica]|uniref:Uncharacterized protein n=1 Tax=Poriferisphaera corsica TaxID=2528020 RepID=A0A517YSX0_9BACT|nr:hypothetical protein KS4_13640 [Poriferisphaera corsica]
MSGSLRGGYCDGFVRIMQGEGGVEWLVNVGFDLIGDSSEVWIKVLLGKEVEAFGGEFVVGAPDTGVKIGEFGVDLDEDARFAGGFVFGGFGYEFGEICGERVDAGAADADDGALLEVLVVEEPDVRADDWVDVDVKKLLVLGEPFFDFGLKLVREGAVSSFSAEMRTRNDEELVGLSACGGWVWMLF